MENKKYFTSGAGLVPEDRQRSKETDDRTLDQIGTIFKYIHNNQKVTASVVNAGRYMGAWFFMLQLFTFIMILPP